MTTYEVIQNGVVIDTITVENIDTLDGYELPEGNITLVKIN
jgi:hypothetical protein